MWGERGLNPSNYLHGRPWDSRKTDEKLFDISPARIQSLASTKSVSYTHLTLPTILRV